MTSEDDKTEWGFGDGAKVLIVGPGADIGDVVSNQDAYCEAESEITKETRAVVHGAYAFRETASGEARFNRAITDVATGTDHIVVLPSWEVSPVACLVILCAMVTGLPVWEFDTRRRLIDATPSDLAALLKEAL
jgi:hypothetical protein